MDCMREAWNEALSEEKVVLAWAKDGLWPFTRICYWEAVVKRQKLERKRKAAEDVGQLQRLDRPPPVVARGQGGAGPSKARRVTFEEESDEDNQSDGEEGDVDDGDEDGPAAEQGAGGARGGRGLKFTPALHAAVGKLHSGSQGDDVDEMLSQEVRAELKMRRDTDTGVVHAFRAAVRRCKLNPDLKAPWFQNFNPMRIKLTSSLNLIS